MNNECILFAASGVKPQIKQNKKTKNKEKNPDYNQTKRPKIELFQINVAEMFLLDGNKSGIRSYHSDPTITHSFGYMHYS